MTSKEDRRFVVLPGGQLHGQIKVPGDKSISHRAIMLGALAEGETIIQGFLHGEDTLATLRAFQQMGVSIENSDSLIRIHGVGLHGLKPSPEPLDLGNSGTSVRLMTGLLAGQDFNSTLIGDTSLMQRPMRRVIDPLITMGASITSTDKGTLPVTIKGGQALHGIDYTLPVASAQLKSCLLLAGMYARGQTTIIEPEPTRDHTERMLSAFMNPLQREGNRISIYHTERLVGTEIHVPSDFSSAAFFIAAASIVPGSDLVLREVGVNPTRHAMLAIMQAMGADITLKNERMQSGEPVADLHIKSATLSGIDIPEELVPVAIDEFPAILVAAAVANGTTRLTGAAELRVKESDRIQAMLDGLLALGIDATASDDGMVVNGGQLRGGIVESHGDHRIAMAFAVAGMVAGGPVHIRDCANVATSFPGFVELARHAGMNISYE